ncbi:MAG TPA: hypothetical protein VHA77_15760 [Xanthobacteraceae bacterium]|nr:hypothetical protein [Xanthobacteraceae bacterium]
MAVRGRLPNRVPVGTRYVIEGEPGQEGELNIISRYLVFPDGTRVNLKPGSVRLDQPAAAAARLKSAGRRLRLRKRSPKRP